MIKFFILMLLSFLAAKFIGMLYSDGEFRDEKGESTYFITAKDGAIGCLSKEKFLEEQSYYMSGNYAAAQKLLDEEICFFLDKGAKLFAVDGTCSEKDKDDDVFPFKPNDFMLLQPYLPCSAVR